MNSTALTTLLTLTCVGSGFLIGQLVQSQAQPSSLQHSVSNTKSQAPLRSARSASSSFQFLNDASSQLRAAPEFNTELKRLYRELKSPLRANSLLGYQLHENSFDEWELLLQDRQVQHEGLLNDLGRRLATEDPERALNMFLVKPKIRVNGMAQHYALRDGILQTVARTAPEKGLAALQAMERGGGQMDNSLYFSKQWVNHDPAEAAKHFEELVTLRNMNFNGDINMPRDRYANDLMKSWVRQDQATAAAYVEELPHGSTKTTLVKAFKKFEKE